MKNLDKIILLIIVFFVILYVKFIYKIFDKYLSNDYKHPTYGDKIFIHIAIMIFIILTIITLINKYFR